MTVAQGDTIPIGRLGELLGRVRGSRPQTRHQNRKRSRSLVAVSPESFAALCLAAGIPAPVREYRFDDTTSGRRWRFDFCWPSEGVALEVEGAVWIQGRHTRGSGYVRDLEKYSQAAIQGWTLVRCTTDQMQRGEGLSLVLAAFARRRR